LANLIGTLKNSGSSGTALIIILGLFALLLLLALVILDHLVEVCQPFSATLGLTEQRVHDLIPKLVPILILHFGHQLLNAFYYTLLGQLWTSSTAKWCSRLKLPRSTTWARILVFLHFIYAKIIY